MTRGALVLAVGLSLLAAGCVGFVEDLTPGGDGDDSGNDSYVEPTGEERGNDTSNESEENASDSNESANDTSGNESDFNRTEPSENETSEGNETTWTYDNRTGTVSGNNLLVTEASETETFNVSTGAEELRLNLSADGGELDVCIQAASGNASGNGSGEDEGCTAEESTEDGNLTWSETAPAEGEWSVEMTAQGTGPQSVDYELAIAQKVPANGTSRGNESGNETDDDYPATIAGVAFAPVDLELGWLPIAETWAD